MEELAFFGGCGTVIEGIGLLWSVIQRFVEMYQAPLN
jgi:hypothetical protein